MKTEMRFGPDHPASMRLDPEHGRVELEYGDKSASVVVYPSEAELRRMARLLLDMADAIAPEVDPEAEQTPKSKARKALAFADAFSRTMANAPHRGWERRLEEAEQDAWTEVLELMQEAGLISEDADPYDMDHDALLAMLEG